jgi:hypothetical protein
MTTMTRSAARRTSKKSEPIYSRVCLRCGHGPYFPRKPQALDCPKCHMPYNTPAVRNTRPEPTKGKHSETNHAKATPRRRRQ